MPLGKGIGIGCGFFISGSGLPIHWDPNRFPHATVHIQVDMDGGVTVHTGRPTSARFDHGRCPRVSKCWPCRWT